MDIITMISGVGFPIVAFLLMYRFSTDTMRKNTEALHELKEVIARLRK